MDTAVRATALKLGLKGEVYSRLYFFSCCWSGICRLVETVGLKAAAAMSTESEALLLPQCCLLFKLSSPVLSILSAALDVREKALIRIAAMGVEIAEAGVKAAESSTNPRAADKRVTF